MLTARIINNKLIPDNKELLMAEIAKRNNKKVRIEIVALGPKTRMHAFLYGVVYPAFREHCGHDTIEDVDKDLKGIFFYKHVENKLTGETEKVLKSKSAASHEEIQKYVSDCVMFGNTEHGLQIMSGEEYWQS